MIAILLLSFSWHIPPPVKGNLFTYKGDEGCGGSPYLTANDSTDVFLKEETISVTFGDEAEVKARYILCNPSNESVVLEICLPFMKRPKTIESYEGFEDYEWEETTIIFKEGTKYEEKNRFHSILFSTEIHANSSKTISIGYVRSYGRETDWTDPEIYCSYKYLSRTGSLWNHPIENATFIFKIPENNFREGTPSSWYANRTDQNTTWECTINTTLWVS